MASDITAQLLVIVSYLVAFTAIAAGLPCSLLNYLTTCQVYVLCHNIKQQLCGLKNFAANLHIKLYCVSHSIYICALCSGENWFTSYQVSCFVLSISVCWFVISTARILDKSAALRCAK